MMYVQITTRCNMLCPHCCYSCTAKGEDMSFKVFKKALEYDECSLAIGGGEPTIHPRFEKFLLYALAKCDYVWMATNGKKTDIALVLADLARGLEKLSVELSQDEYHEPINEKVVEKFKLAGKTTSYGNSNIRNTTMHNCDPMKFGRARVNFPNSTNITCPCEAHIIKPDGTVYQCGCDDSLVIGNIFDGFQSLDPDDDMICHRDIKNKD